MCILDSLRTMWHAEHSVSTSFATKRNFLVGKVTYHGLKSAGSFIIDKIVTAHRTPQLLHILHCYKFLFKLLYIIYIIIYIIYNNYIIYYSSVDA